MNLSVSFMLKANQVKNLTDIVKREEISTQNIIGHA
jgi:hypothetical protein